jgi:hypothetical protein
MVLRVYLFSLYLTLFLSFGLLSLIFFNVNPYTSPVWMIMLFYFTFFLLWMSFFGLVGFYLKVWASNSEVIFAHILPTLRQSAFISLALTGLLFLFQIKVLSWWMAGLFILAVLMVELYFRKK